MDLPDCIDTITFSRVFRVKECYAGCAWLSRISNGEYEYWSDYCPLQDIIMVNPETLTIEIELNVHQLTLKDESYLSAFDKLPKIIPLSYNMKTHIDYTLNHDELEMIPKSSLRKSMCGDIVDRMWNIEILPKNSSSTTVDVSIL